MLDIKFIRENSEVVRRMLENRGFDLELEAILALDKERRQIIQEVESLKHERKIVSDQIAKMKKGDPGGGTTLLVTFPEFHWTNLSFEVSAMLFANGRALALCLVATFMMLSPTALRGQLSEGEMTRFMPTETFLLVSINMETVMQGVDKDSDLLKKFRTREKFSPTDFTEVSQYLMLVTANEFENASEYDLPGAIITRYAEAVDRDGYMTEIREDGFGGWKFEADAWVFQ